MTSGTTGHGGARTAGRGPAAQRGAKAGAPEHRPVAASGSRSRTPEPGSTGSAGNGSSPTVRARIAGRAASAASTSRGSGAAPAQHPAGSQPAAAPVLGLAVLRRIAPVQLECATCGEISTVDVVRFAALHVPLFVWRPGRGFTRLMTCPACRRRSWVSASWPASWDDVPGPVDG
ncbi:MAG: hypothetical protein M0013_02720 [Actinomycetota bacterium]|nr:hypothetical protein [Actinomycetota bacterium]